MAQKVKLKTDYITLGQLLKIVDIISSGGQAKWFLQENDVMEIRRLYKNKEMSSRQLAEKYKVNISTIQRVLSRKTWNHLK